MSRLPAIDQANFTPEVKEIWKRVGAGRATGLAGPLGVLMHSPELADRFAHLENYFRTDAELPPIDRELVILAAVREMDARFAWSRHELRGREIGARPEAIEIIRAKGGLDGLADHERLLVELVRALVRTRALPADLYARGQAELGDTQMVEVVTLVGHYISVGLIITAFDVPTPADADPTF